MSIERKKIALSLPVIVEGKYDKIKLSAILDAAIITTDGFGVFKCKEKLRLIQRCAEHGVIVLTDSDGAGKLIRSHISGIVPKDKIYNLYIPRIKGKERRKTSPSKEGTLGVEGIDTDTLYALFSDFVRKHCDPSERSEPITKADLYAAALTGAPDSGERRDKLAVSLGLPPSLTSPALLSALNTLMTREEFLNMYGLSEN